MAVLTEEERRELQELAASPALREDLQTLAAGAPAISCGTDR